MPLSVLYTNLPRRTADAADARPIGRSTLILGKVAVSDVALGRVRVTETRRR